MEVILDKVVPIFLEPEKLLNSPVWKQQLHFAGGKHVHIVAASGRGKTSLIHFLYGMRHDYEGDISFDGRSVKSFSSENWSFYRANKISIIFQDLKLFENHTVLENIEVKKQLMPYPAAASIKEMASTLGIEAKLHKKINTCSYGEQQRVAIIRALQQPFELLLMDEPFSHLDEANRGKAMELIRSETGKRNASMLLADLKEINYFPADQTYTL